MNKQPSVLIVILNYGTYDLTLNLIDEIRSKLDYENYDIMVIDNCSPNKSAEVLEKNSADKGFIFYGNSINAGYAAGNNVGIRYGINHGYEYSWILNNDVELKENNVLSHMVRIAEKHKHIGCVGPMVFSLEGNICAPYVNRLTIWNMTFGIITEKKNRQKHINTSREVYRVYGCCMLLKNTVMREINCMDERTFLYGEEDILAERMMEMGYTSYYDSDVSIIHKESASMKRMTKQRKKMQVAETNKSMEIYLKEYRHYPVIIRWICKIVRTGIIYLR